MLPPALPGFEPLDKFSAHFHKSLHVDVERQIPILFPHIVKLIITNNDAGNID